MHTKLQEQVIELKNAIIELLQNCDKVINDEFDDFEQNIKLILGDTILFLLVLATIYEQKFTGKDKKIYGILKHREVPMDNISTSILEEEAITLEKRISLLNKIIKIVEEIEKELTISNGPIKNILSTVKMWKELLQDCTKERNSALSNLISMCFQNPNVYSKIIERLVSSQDSQIKMMCDSYSLSELLTDKSSNKPLRKI